MTKTDDDIVKELLEMAGQSPDSDDHGNNEHKLQKAEDDRLTVEAVSLLDQCMAEVDAEQGKHKLADSAPLKTLRTFDHDCFKLAGGDRSKMKNIYTLADIQSFNLPKAALCIPAA